MKKTLLTISTVAVVSFGGLFVGSEGVQAQSLDQVKKEQKEVKEKMSQAEQKLADVLYEIKDLGQEINKIEAEIKKADDEIDTNKNEVKELQKEVDELNKEIERREEVLKNRLSAYQDNGGHLNLKDALFGTESIVDVYSKIETAVTITNSDQELMEATANDKAAVEQKQMDIERINEKLEEEKKKNKERKEEKKAQEKTLNKKKSNFEKDYAKLENKSSELTALRADIERSLAAPVEPVVASTSVANNDTNNETTESSNNNATSNNNGTSATTTTAAPAQAQAAPSTTGTSAAPAKKASKPKSVPYTGGGGSAIAAGKQFIGKSKYSLGAQNPSTGTFDCSGFVQWAYQQEGVSLPRTAGAMAGVGQKVPYSQAKPGDLVFFRGGGHVGIYLGGGKFLGSQSSTAVAIADMNSGYWKQHFDGNVRRVK